LIAGDTRRPTHGPRHTDYIRHTDCCSFFPIRHTDPSRHTGNSLFVAAWRPTQQAFPTHGAFFYFICIGDSCLLLLIVIGNTCWNSFLSFFIHVDPINDSSCHLSILLTIVSCCCWLIYRRGLRLLLLLMHFFIDGVAVFFCIRRSYRRSCCHRLQAGILLYFLVSILSTISSSRRASKLKPNLLCVVPATAWVNPIDVLHFSFHFSLPGAPSFHRSLLLFLSTQQQICIVHSSAQSEQMNPRSLRLHGHAADPFVKPLLGLLLKLRSFSIDHLPSYFVLHRPSSFVLPIRTQRAILLSMMTRVLPSADPTYGSTSSRASTRSIHRQNADLPLTTNHHLTG